MFRQMLAGLAVHDGRETAEADVLRDGEQEHDRVLAQSSRGTCTQCYNLHVHVCNCLLAINTKLNVFSTNLFQTLTKWL